MRLWWGRKIRFAKIHKEDRDLFERYGEPVVVGILTSGLNPRPADLQQVYCRPDRMQHAADWLTERSDVHEQREQRLETAEWAILIFVVLGVFADVWLLAKTK